VFVGSPPYDIRSGFRATKLAEALAKTTGWNWQLNHVYACQRLERLEESGVFTKLANGTVDMVFVYREGESRVAGNIVYLDTRQELADDLAFVQASLT
jgi:hypothetical protein